MRHHDFRRILDALKDLSPAQIEDAQNRIQDLRRKTEAVSEIEARTSGECKCPFCGDDRRQKWGRTRTKIQRYRCKGCKKTYSGRTGSALGRIHRPDLFMVALQDMLGDSAPQSVRRLARRLGLHKHTIWRWRMLVFRVIRNGEAARFAGIVEADETHQRESRKGSREWVRHFADPLNVPKPPRPRWEDFTTQGLKMMRGLSRWQLPILTVADRGGARYFQRLADRRSSTLESAMRPLVPSDAVLCSDGAKGYGSFAATACIEHFAVGSKAGTRVAAGFYHIQNVSSLHARYKRFIKPFCGPATKNLDGYIRWLEVRLAGLAPAEIIRPSSSRRRTRVRSASSPEQTSVRCPAPCAAGGGPIFAGKPPRSASPRRTTDRGHGRWTCGPGRADAPRGGDPGGPRPASDGDRRASGRHWAGVLIDLIISSTSNSKLAMRGGYSLNDSSSWPTSDSAGLNIQDRSSSQVS